MTIKQKNSLRKLCYHLFVAAFGFIMIYPLLWMVFSSFKETNLIFVTAGELLPTNWIIDNYITGWKGFSGTTFATFFANSMFISVVATVGTVCSSALVAYGFSRCKFRGKGLLFVAMLSTMMLPAQILMIPQYLWYNTLGWTGSYLPLIVPYYFATQGFFVYLIYNFTNGIPRDLDEAARIDGCSYYTIFGRIIVPLVLPAMITASIFSFIWRWDDFLSALLYVSNSSKYPVSLALKLFSDPGSSTDYGAMFAMSSLSLLPVVIIFMFSQRYLVEGISTSGLKG